MWPLVGHAWLHSMCSLLVLFRRHNGALNTYRLHCCVTHCRAEPLFGVIFAAAFAANVHVPSFIFFLHLEPCPGGFNFSRTQAYTAEISPFVIRGPGSRAHCVISSPVCSPSLNLKGPFVTHQVLGWTCSVPACYVVAPLPRWQPCLFTFSQAEQVFLGLCSLQQRNPLTS